MPKVTDYVEHRAGGWDAAAYGLIDRLTSQQVGLCQIVRIDAHNNGPEDDAIFTCYYSKEVPKGIAVTRDSLRFVAQNNK